MLTFIAAWLKRRISTLHQAHWLYTLGRYAQARMLTENVLEQEPDNASARELLRLIMQRETIVRPERPDRAEALLLLSRCASIQRC